MASGFSTDPNGPSRLGQRIQYAGRQRQNINNALTGNDVNVADITRATALRPGAPASSVAPPPWPNRSALGEQVAFAGTQRQRIHQALTGDDPNLRNYNVADIVGATNWNLNQNPNPMRVPAAVPTTPLQQQVQYAGGTQQAVNDAMNAPGVTIAELIRRIANRPRF